MQPHPRRCPLLTGLPLKVRSARTWEINRASRAELESLPCIGPVLARHLSAQGLRIDCSPFEGAPARPSSFPSSSSSAASPQTR